MHSGETWAFDRAKADWKGPHLLEFIVSERDPPCDRVTAVGPRPHPHAEHQKLQQKTGSSATSMMYMADGENQTQI